MNRVILGSVKKFREQENLVSKDYACSTSYDKNHHLFNALAC